MIEQERQSSDKALQGWQSFQKMKNAYCRFGVAVLVVLVIWNVFFSVLSLVVEIATRADASLMTFFERYLLVFNELGLALGIIAAMKIMGSLPICEEERKPIGAGRFVKYITICFAIASLGNMIGNWMITFWNAETGLSAGQEMDELFFGTDLLVLTFSACIVAPFLEEFLFRKLLIDHVRQFGELPCILMSGLLFGLFHGNFSQFFYGFGLGIFFAYLYFRSGSFVLVFSLHAIFNFFAGVLSILVTELSVYAEMLYLFVYLILVVIGAVLCLIGIRGFKPKKGEGALSRKDCFTAAYGNGGIVVAVIFMLVSMIMSLFSL